MQLWYTELSIYFKKFVIEKEFSDKCLLCDFFKTINIINKNALYQEIKKKFGFFPYLI